MKQYSLKGLEELIKASDEYSTLASDKQIEINDKCNWFVTRFIQGLGRISITTTQKESFIIGLL